MRLAKMEAFTYKNLKIFYKKTGSGKPMIFLHNGGNSHIIWDHQVEYFSRTHTCYAFDLPGYGMSVNPDIRYPLELYTSFLDAFIAGQNLAPVTLVGNCIGSATSLTYAMKKPDNVARLVLFNILTQKTVWDGTWGIFFKLTAPVPKMRELLHNGFGNWKIPQPVAHYSVVSQFGDRGYRDPDLIKALKKHYSQKGQIGALIDILADIESFGPMDNFEIPAKFPGTLVIWGEKNKVLPAKAGQILCERLKPRKLEIIKGGGHVVMHELHQEIDDILKEFIG